LRSHPPTLCILVQTCPVQNAGRGCVGDQVDFHGSRSRGGVKRLNRFLANCFVANQLAVSTCVDEAGRASCRVRSGWCELCGRKLAAGRGGDYYQTQFGARSAVARPRIHHYLALGHWHWDLGPGRFRLPAEPKACGKSVRFRRFSLRRATDGNGVRPHHCNCPVCALDSARFACTRQEPHYEIRPLFGGWVRHK
jgi:hypothetical protein